MALPTVSGQFRLVEDPTLKFAQSGVAVARLRLVANSRKQVNGEWQDDKVCWLSANAFGKLAEHIAESVGKGDLVTAVGRIETQEWEAKDGSGKRSDHVLLLDSLGLDLTFDSAKKIEAQQQAPQGNSNSAWGAPAGNDEPPF